MLPSSCSLFGNSPPRDRHTATARPCKALISTDFEFTRAIRAPNTRLGDGVIHRRLAHPRIVRLGGSRPPLQVRDRFGHIRIDSRKRIRCFHRLAPYSAIARRATGIPQPPVHARPLFPQTLNLRARGGKSVSIFEVFRILPPPEL